VVVLGERIALTPATRRAQHQLAIDPAQLPPLRTLRALNCPTIFPVLSVASTAGRQSPRRAISHVRPFASARAAREAQPFKRTVPMSAST
jgi:hypothetical protein